MLANVVIIIIITTRYHELLLYSMCLYMQSFFQRCQCSLFAWICAVPFQRGRAGDRAGAGRIPACAGACQRPSAVGRFRRRAPGGVVRSSPSDLSPPLLRSWCGLIGVAAAILAVFGWFNIANIQHSECVCQVFLQLFL